MASFADSCIVLRAEHTLGENWEKHVKHLSRSRSTRGGASAPWRILGAVLLALGMVLLLISLGLNAGLGFIQGRVRS